MSYEWPDYVIQPRYDYNELLSAAELSELFRCAPDYIRAMKRAGFPMPAGRATFNWAVAWLTANPDFRQNKPPPSEVKPIESFHVADGDELLAAKEIAARMKLTSAYIYAMKKAGFPMLRDRATLHQAVDWLLANPNFRKNSPD